MTCNFIRETAGRGSSVHAHAHREVTLSCFVQLYIPRNLHIGQQSGGIKLRGYKNLKSHLRPVLKLRNRDSDDQKRFNRKSRRCDGADVHRRMMGNPAFWHWWKIRFACQTCTKVTFYQPNMTWKLWVFSKLFNCWLLTWLWVIWFHNKPFKCVTLN